MDAGRDCKSLTIVGRTTLSFLWPLALLLSPLFERAKPEDESEAYCSNCSTVSDTNKLMAILSQPPNFLITCLLLIPIIIFTSFSFSNISHNDLSFSFLSKKKRTSYCPLILNIYIYIYTSI